MISSLSPPPRVTNPPETVNTFQDSQPFTVSYHDTTAIDSINDAWRTTWRPWPIPPTLKSGHIISYESCMTEQTHPKLCQAALTASQLQWSVDCRVVDHCNHHEDRAICHPISSSTSLTVDLTAATADVCTFCKSWEMHRGFGK